MRRDFTTGFLRVDSNSSLSPPSSVFSLYLSLSLSLSLSWFLSLDFCLSMLSVCAFQLEKSNRFRSAIKHSQCLCSESLRHPNRSIEPPVQSTFRGGCVIYGDISARRFLFDRPKLLTCASLRSGTAATPSFCDRFQRYLRHRPGDFAGCRRVHSIAFIPPTV